MKKYILLFALLVSACNMPGSAPATEPTTDEAVGDAPQTEVVTQTENNPPVEAQPAASLPAGPVHIVALGDSLTQGDGDDTGRGYPGRLLDMVNSVRPDSTLSNFGQSGWSSDALINGDQGLESQLTRAVSELQDATAQGKAGLALVWIGSNDLWYLYEFGGDIDDAGDASDAQRFETNIDTILSQLRGTGAQVVIALLDDQSKRPIALKGEAFVAITPDELARMSAHVDVYNQIIRDKAAQYGALTVDFYSTDIFTNPATLYDDGNHPNQAGYDIIAQKWFDAITPILQ
jgi:lysophospholipase L1-like esterase